MQRRLVPEYSLQPRKESIPFFSQAARQCVSGEVPLVVAGYHEEAVNPPPPKCAMRINKLFFF